MANSGVAGALERLYQRSPRHYLDAFYWSWFVGSLAVAASVALATGPTFVQSEGDTEWHRGVLLLVGLWATAGLVVHFQVRRVSEPLRRWAQGERTAEHARRALEPRLSFSAARRALATGVVVILIPFTFYVAIEFQFTPREVFLATVMFLSAGLWFIAILRYGMDIVFRPIRRDMVGALGHGLSVEVGTSRLGLRTLAAMGLLTLLTGFVVAFAATADDGSRDELVRLIITTVVVAATTSGLLALLATRSITAPVEDLDETVRRVRDGDLAARATVTTTDEIGVLARSFNEMLDGLEAATQEVLASRERIVTAAEAERRRVERNIHDGAQQQLVALALRLRLLQERVPEDPAGAVDEIEGAVGDLQQALAQLRELAEGLHPSVLSTDGLGAALRGLADRATVPVTVEIDEHQRWPEMTESTAWFVASEALANVGKYARATVATVSAVQRDGHLVVEVTDDGIGGADLGAGSGLRGLADRVEAVGGTLTIVSPPGRGTAVRAELPVPSRLGGDGDGVVQQVVQDKDT